MLISKKYNFIFIHIYKNAGTSITAALKPFAESRVPRLFEDTLRSLRIPIYDPSPFPDHIRAKEVAARIGYHNFHKYFSFAFIRNPWDWQVSLYTYMLKEERHHQHDLMKQLGSFEKYIKWRCANEVRYQKDFIYSDDNELLVDFVGRYERLNEDFNIICNNLGIRAELPTLNVSNNKPYQVFYSKETKDLVQQHFAPDIDLFEYEF